MNQKKSSHNLIGIFLVSLCALIWGFAFLAQRSASSDVPVFTFNGFRFALAVVTIGAMILVNMLVDKKRDTTRTGWNKSTFIGGTLCGVCLFIANNLQQYGVAHTSLGKSGFITALYIVIVPLLSVLIRKRIPAHAWIAVALGMVGFYLMCMGDDASLSFNEADYILLLCAIGFSMQIIFIDVYVGDTDPFKLTFVQFLVASVLSLPAMAIEGFPPIEAIGNNVWSILYVGIFSAGIGFTFQTIGQKYTTPELATLIMSMEAVISLIAGVAILHEPCGTTEFIGCMVVMFAVFIAQLYVPHTMLRPNYSKYFVE